MLESGKSSGDPGDDVFREVFISENMLYVIWYCATITMLFLIEHVVWMYVLWVESTDKVFPFWRLGVAYLGVLVACVLWVMEVMVPMEPNVGGLHSLFCKISF